MELKSYFKKFGIGWIVLGIAIAFSGFILGLYSLLTSETKNTVNPNVWQEYVRGEIVYLILIIIIVLLVPFLFGFFGFTKLFRSMMIGLGITIIIGILNWGSTDSGGGIAMVFILILSFIMGVISELRKRRANSA